MNLYRASFLLSFCVLLFAAGLRAQDSTSYCVPGCVDQPRPKGFELTYERMLDYGIVGRRTDVEPGDYSTEVRRNARWKVRLRLPVINKPSWKLSLNLGYSTENYALEPRSGSEVQVLSLLDNKYLRSMQAGVYVVKPFIGNRYVVVRANAALNDDGTGTFTSKRNALKYDMAAIYAIKRRPTLVFGFGIAFSYTLGRGSWLPVFAYDRSINQHWGVELLLPSSVRVRYAFGQGNLLMTGAKLEGANYNIRLNGQGLEGVYFLERSDLRTFVRYEREIHDWLWFGMDVGYNTNLDFALVTDHGNSRGDVILTNKVASAFYFNTGLFVVPPKSMWK